MAEYRYQVGELAPAIITAHDDASAQEMAWAMIHDDNRDGVQGKALPATLKRADGTVLLEMTVADIEKRWDR